ncbi:MAG: protein kinase domain-containing protein, partial [Planctomycetota bacterium]
MKPRPEDLLRIAKEKGQLDEGKVEEAEEILKRLDAGGDAQAFAGSLVEEGLVTSDTAQTLLNFLVDPGEAAPDEPTLPPPAFVPQTRVSGSRPEPGVGSGPPSTEPTGRGSSTSGKFMKGRRLGVGGMGEVMEATDPDLRRDVAIKTVLDPGRAGRRDRFLEEAQITGQLEHPNIVPVYELGFGERSTPYMVMKKVRGRSLDEVLEGITET